MEPKKNWIALENAFKHGYIIVKEKRPPTTGPVSHLDCRAFFIAKAIDHLS
jgi:hypothetical protein